MKITSKDLTAEERDAAKQGLAKLKEFHVSELNTLNILAQRATPVPVERIAVHTAAIAALSVFNLDTDAVVDQYPDATEETTTEGDSTATVPPPKS